MRAITMKKYQNKKSDYYFSIGTSLPWKLKFYIYRQWYTCNDNLHRRLVKSMIRSVTKKYNYRMFRLIKIVQWIKVTTSFLFENVFPQTKKKEPSLNLHRLLFLCECVAVSSGVLKVFLSVVIRFLRNLFTAF